MWPPQERPGGQCRSTNPEDGRGQRPGNDVKVGWRVSVGIGIESIMYIHYELYQTWKEVYLT